jgi:hypothetical protein
MNFSLAIAQPGYFRSACVLVFTQVHQTRVQAFVPMAIVMLSTLYVAMHPAAFVVVTAAKPIVAKGGCRSTLHCVALATI